MPKFRYRAIDRSGTMKRGTIEAANFAQADEELRSQGLWTVDLVDKSELLLYREIKLFEPRVSSEAFAIFCRQLSTMYRSGMHLVEALEALSRQTESKTLGNLLRSIADEMKQGTQLSSAAEKHPTVFSTIFISMIRAGEASGNLDEMLERLAVFYEKEHYTREKVKSALIYPVVMGVISVVVVTFMMIFVIPNYVASFNEMGLDLPLPTRIVIQISEFLQRFWYVMLLIFFVPYLLLWTIRKHPRGQYALDYMKLKVPVFGLLWHKQAIARFSRTFSTLFAAAIPVMNILPIVAKVVSNEAISKLILDAREGVRSGISMAEPFRKSWLFPPMVVQMIIVGESTGALDSMLAKIADFYEQDVDTMADRLKSLLEPLMILALAVIIGGIVLAIMLPAFKLMESM